MSKEEVLLAQMTQDVKAIVTINQLVEYLYRFKSPVVGEIINPAPKYFFHDFMLPNGKLDRKSIKERQQLGLKNRITLESEITPEICSALKSWLGYHGRDLGTGFSAE